MARRRLRIKHQKTYEQRLAKEVARPREGTSKIPDEANLHILSRSGLLGAPHSAEEELGQTQLSLFRIYSLC